MPRLLSAILFLIVYLSSPAQDLLRNGSFEGEDPYYDRIPMEWYVCDETSTPDVQPISSDRPAFRGTTYLGLVARVQIAGNKELEGTVESVQQELSDSLIPGNEYKLRLYLMYDPNHKPSVPRTVGPGSVSLFIGKQICQEYRVIWESSVIDHETWKPYEIIFTAECGDKYLKIEAGFGETEGYELNYLMVDHMSLESIGPYTTDELDGCDLIGVNPEDTISGHTGICHLYAPNAFTPNGDGFNDIFRIYTRCNIFTYSLQIFNRWGNLVFQSNNKETGWTGENQDHAESLGVYYYHLTMEYADENGERQELTYGNTITLIR